MATCEDDGEPFAEARSHPWTNAASSDAFRYDDLEVDPGRTRTSLEDFAPWESYPAVGEMYKLFEWLNSPRSIVESNDRAFSGPQPNVAAASRDARRPGIRRKDARGADHRLVD